MDFVQLILDQIKSHSEAELSWLKELCAFLTQNICPLLCGSGPPAAGDAPTGSVSQLGVGVVKWLQEVMAVKHTLPVSYRLVSISELVARQRVACVSNLSWSTSQQRAWAREAEQVLPGLRALPRVNLLLIGCLREGRGGEWRLTDASGSVRCECLSPSPIWVNRPLFLSHWNYIPQDATGQDGEEERGYVELIGSPVLLDSGPEQGLADSPGGGPGLRRVVGVKDAAACLHNSNKGLRISVCGCVSSVCPQLVIGGTTFFIFILKDDTLTLPVLVKDSSRLWWHQCVCVGQRVCVTALRVCILRGWRENRILCVTNQSEIHKHADEHTQESTQNTSTCEQALNTHTYTQESTQNTPTQEHTLNTHTQETTQNPHTDTLLLLSHDGEDLEEAEPQRHVVQSTVRIKQSRVIGYQGIVTEVLSEGSGLYMIDGKVGLCLAYQPTLRRKLRPGDAVELHHIHFLYGPCPDSPPSMLCACLRSSLRVTAFSRVTGPSDASHPSDKALPRLLLERNMGVAEYLWICHMTRQLRQSLVPTLLKEECVSVLAWKLIEFVWRGRGGGMRRDIYSEMLDEPHTCPLTQYSINPSVSRCLSLSDCLHSLQSDLWSGLSLSSLLPPGAESLTTAQLNAALSWSYQTLSSDPHQDHPPSGGKDRQRPLVLVGVLAFPSQPSEHTLQLQLKDQKGTMSCVVTETREEEAGLQNTPFNTAWIGCLVCVQKFTMVTERFLQSGFPSYKHLKQEKYITHKHHSVYLQFSLDDVHILIPSDAMVTILQETKREESRAAGSDRKRKREEEGELDSSHSTKDSSHITKDFPNLSSSDTVQSGCSSQTCVSMVIRVEQKEGVARRNIGMDSTNKAGFSLCFSAKATAIGPVVSWERDPKNCRLMEREVATEAEREKVVLLFLRSSIRWFPSLHPGCIYRLVAVNTQDLHVLIGSGIAGRSGVDILNDRNLQVRSDWRFHTLPRLLLLPAYKQSRSPRILSISEVIDCSPAELVCFHGLVTERISLNDKTSSAGKTHTGVRLTLNDQSGRSLQVYLDIGHTSYTPGMLPGNILLLSGFQRKLSKSGSVYCRSLPVSSITVISLGDTCLALPPPAPIIHLGSWEPRYNVGQVKAHVACFLSLQLQWSCSQCGSVYTQSCSSSCGSSSSVFQSKAKLVVDDGTGEAHVLFSNLLVRPLLRLAESQWEGLQRLLRVRGHIRVYTRGRSLVCEPSDDDALLQYLVCVCSSDIVCRPISLTCRIYKNSQHTHDLRRFSRGDRDFMTRMNPPLQLTCLHLDTESESVSGGGAG
ncbi:CST complex subunit CTC1 isoform X2 [Genypterus blacodes]|uniref:CST complex subunit CTC1 isoform X2 n=1 Tax=Genypterus blacodes TaxID=154954 RepID=UPI003F75D7E4